MIKVMDLWLPLGTLGLLGLMFGSFAGAQVWRLRAHQLQSDDQRRRQLEAQSELTDEETQEKEGLAADASERRVERKKLDGLLGPVSRDYSRCLHCQHRLRWYDLLPLLSWLSTGGRCRYCKTPIGRFEPLIELGVAIVFALSYLLWPLPLAQSVGQVGFVLWLAAVVLLAFLFSYDLKWFLLPDRIVFPLIAIGFLAGILHVATAPDIGGAVLSLVGAVLILCGLYYVLWLVSKGQWVGFGDVKLGLALALLLSDWRLAFVALFSANLIGSLLVMPGVLTGRISRKAHVPFGPLLIAGAVLAMLLGSQIIAWYQTVLL